MATFEIDGKMTVEELIKLLAPKLTPELFAAPLPQEDMMEVTLTDETTYREVLSALDKMFETKTYMYKTGNLLQLQVKKMAPAYRGKPGTLVVTKDMTANEFKSRILQKFGIEVSPCHIVRDTYGHDEVRYWPGKRTLESIGLLDPFKIVKK